MTSAKHEHELKVNVKTVRNLSIREGEVHAGQIRVEWACGEHACYCAIDPLSKSVR